jgi:hypothetical protein
MSTTIPTRRRFINIKNFVHMVGTTGTGANTITDVTVGRRSNMIRGAGDDDRYSSFMAEGMRDVDISITIDDPVQREALQALAPGTVTFDGTPEEGGTAYTVTLTNVKWHSGTLSARHNGLWGGNLSGTTYSPDGQTDPMTIAAAA